MRDTVLAALAAVAEDERARISERTETGLRRVGKEGKQLGRPSKLERHRGDLLSALRTVEARVAEGEVKAAEAETLARRGAIALTGFSYNTARKCPDLHREEGTIIRKQGP